jgi:hypothetical protein
MNRANAWRSYVGRRSAPATPIRRGAFLTMVEMGKFPARCEESPEANRLSRNS